MPVVKKRRKAANDHRPLSSQRMSYVVFERPYWNARRKVAAWGLAALVGVLIVAAALKFAPAPILMAADPVMPAVIMTTARPVPVAAAEIKQPYDIRLDASALAPQAQSLLDVAEKLPASVVEMRPPPHHARIVENDEVVPALADGDAVENDRAAQNLVAKGDVRLALQFEHRAAELDPANMLLRMKLAVLFDRAGDNAEASQLYKQVLQAYDAHDASLPRTLDIDGIRRRVAYVGPRD